MMFTFAVLGTVWSFCSFPEFIVMVNQCGILSYMMLVAECYQGGCSIYVALYENDFLGLLMEMMILVIVPLIYQGLIDLTEKIGNPFGGDEIDFPGELYQKQLLAQCNEFIEVCCPITSSCL